MRGREQAITQNRHGFPMRLSLHGQPPHERWVPKGRPREHHENRFLHIGHDFFSKERDTLFRDPFLVNSIGA